MDPSAPDIPTVKTALKRAVAWRTAAEIIRRHPALDLRLLETHPGGGQYDGVTLVRGPDHILVCSFNLAGSSLLLGPPLRPARSTTQETPYPPTVDLWRYPQHGWAEDRRALAIAMEAHLGFPDPPAHHQPSSPTVLALAVIAELLDRLALSDRPVDLRNGWYDSSGHDGCGVRSWTATLPALRGLDATAPSLPLRRAATRCWSLDRAVHPHRPSVVVDLASSRWWCDGQERASFATLYRAGGGIRAMAWELEQSLDERAPFREPTA